VSGNSILVVDDEKGIRDLLELMLIREGYDVSLAEDGEKACRLIEARSFDLVVTDIRLGDIDGIEVLRKAKAKGSDMPVIMISAFSSAETAVEAMKEGAYDYIPKPFNIAEFKRIVKSAIQSHTSSENEDSNSGLLHFGYLLGESPKMKNIYDIIKRVAPTKTNIFISGESGTGKELVAKAVHSMSPRCDKPMIAINCAGLAESLIESELFGYRKGAFTGANYDKTGLFEAANGGTVFLDEIGELTPAIQVKLLRVIQERRFIAVGGTEEKSVDVRIISATNRDLEQEVINGNFREDLYFRLNVIKISVPPLREREGDLELLSNFFLAKYAREQGKGIKKISAYAMNILSGYHFPGNVRELENIIERGVALEASNIILPESLTLANFRERGKNTRGRRRNDIGEEGIDLDQTLADMEREYVMKALAMTGGDRQAASDLLRIPLRSLRYRMEKFGLKLSHENDRDTE